MVGKTLLGDGLFHRHGMHCWRKKVKRVEGPPRKDMPKEDVDRLSNSGRDAQQSPRTLVDEENEKKSGSESSKSNPRANSTPREGLPNSRDEERDIGVS